MPILQKRYNIFWIKWGEEKNYLPKFNIEVTFVDITRPEKVKESIRSSTKLIYCESVDNPLLEIADIPTLAAIANEHDIKLVVDNTFSPMILSDF